jgi:hypothetical protein
MREGETCEYTRIWMELAAPCLKYLCYSDTGLEILNVVVYLSTLFNDIVYTASNEGMPSEL